MTLYRILYSQTEYRNFTVEAETEEAAIAAYNSSEVADETTHTDEFVGTDGNQRIVSIDVLEVEDVDWRTADGFEP